MEINASQLSNALRIAVERGLLPAPMGSAQIRETFAQSLLRASVFSARTANLVYLQELQDKVNRLIAGGSKNDKAQIRLELKQLLQGLGYDPETGFPGEAPHNIPAAERGSLQDLSSDARLNLILDTQRDLATGKATQLQGFSPFALHFTPAWELVRLQTRRVPRGSIDSGSPGWGERWVRLGGPPLITDGGKTRMIALKTDPIWAALGDSSQYDDALDVDHPPFAYRSGMGWLPVPLGECRRLGIDVSDQSAIRNPQSEIALPTPPVNLAGVSEDKRRAALAFLADFNAAHGGFV